MSDFVSSQTFLSPFYKGMYMTKGDLKVNNKDYYNAVVLLVKQRSTCSDLESFPQNSKDNFCVLQLKVSREDESSGKYTKQTTQDLG